MYLATFSIALVIPFLAGLLIPLTGSGGKSVGRWILGLAGLSVAGLWGVCALLCPRGKLLLIKGGMMGLGFSFHSGILEYCLLILLSLVSAVSLFYSKKEDEDRPAFLSLVAFCWCFVQLFLVSSFIFQGMFFLFIWGLLVVVRTAWVGGDLGKEEGKRSAYYFAGVIIFLLFAWITGSKIVSDFGNVYISPSLTEASRTGLVFAALAALTIWGGAPFSTYNYTLRQRVGSEERFLFFAQTAVLGGYLLIKVGTAFIAGESFLPFLILGSIAVLGGGFAALKESDPQHYLVQARSVLGGILLIFLGAGVLQGTTAAFIGVMLSVVLFFSLDVLWRNREVSPGMVRVATWALAVLVCGLPPFAGYFMFYFGYTALLTLPLWQKILFIPIAVLGQGLLLSALLRVAPAKSVVESPGEGSDGVGRWKVIPAIVGVVLIALGPLWYHLSTRAKAIMLNEFEPFFGGWGLGWRVEVLLLLLLGVGVWIVLTGMTRDVPGKLGGGDSPIFRWKPIALLYSFSAGGWLDAYRYISSAIWFISFALLRAERAIDHMPRSIAWALTLPGRLLYDRIFEDKGKGRG